MSKVIKIQRDISAALDAAFRRALEQEQAEGEMVLDIRSCENSSFSPTITKATVTAQTTSEFVSEPIMQPWLTITASDTRSS